MRLTMRTLLSAIALTLFVGAIGGEPAAAQDALPETGRGAPRLVTTTGEAELLVEPDEVILTLGVETSDKDLRTAKRANDALVAAVLAAAEANGVEPKHLQTDHISIEPRYRDNFEQRDFIGYFVRQTIVVTLKDVAKFDAVLTDGLEAGATYVHGIQFRTTALRQHRDAARKLAIQAAREKAVALAGELGQQVGDPYEIREEGSGWWSGYGASWGGRAGAMTQNVIQESSAPVSTEGTLAPGQISVTARVTASFEMAQDAARP